MRIYESTFILSPQADDAAFDRQIKAITDLIDQNQGKIIKEDRWGIRRLAYPIRKFTQGFYTRLVFEGNNEVLAQMERFFRLEEPYIRYLTVLFEGSPEDRFKTEGVHSGDDFSRFNSESDSDSDTERISVTGRGTTSTKPVTDRTSSVEDDGDEELDGQDTDDDDTDRISDDTEV